MNISKIGELLLEVDEHNLDQIERAVWRAKDRKARERFAGEVHEALNDGEVRIFRFTDAEVDKSLFRGRVISAKDEGICFEREDGTDMSVAPWRIIGAIERCIVPAGFLRVPATPNLADRLLEAAGRADDTAVAAVLREVAGTLDEKAA